MSFFTREACLQRLRAQVAAGKPIIGGGAGTGISANCAEAGGFLQSRERDLGCIENLIARDVGREVRRSLHAGVDDQRRQAGLAYDFANKLELDTLGVERADQEDGHGLPFPK